MYMEEKQLPKEKKNKEKIEIESVGSYSFVHHNLCIRILLNDTSNTRK